MGRRRPDHDEPPSCAAAALWGAHPPPAALVHFVCAAWPGSGGRLIAMQLWGKWYHRDVAVQLGRSADSVSVGDKDPALRAVQAQVDEVHGVMQENVNSMLLNADKLEDLRGKASAMGDNSKQFYSLARENRWTQQCREYKLRLLFGGVALLLLLVFLRPWLTAGGDDDKHQQ